MAEKVLKLVTRPEMLTTSAVLSWLKDCVARIEAGEWKPEKAVLLMCQPSVDDPDCVDYLTKESGLTFEQILWLLERAKHCLLHRSTEFND